ncbi:MAG: hypothetical protein ABI220_02600 [Candidatus Saccharimonadales bacterium]
MSKEVSGIPLKNFEDPIRSALINYSELTDGRVVFDHPEQAAKLELTPDKPNSARSIINVLHEHELIGSLFVIAFAPDDATGDNKTFNLGEVVLPNLRPDTKYLPRSKKGTYAEVHLALASQAIDLRYGSEPVMYAGHLSLLGLIDENNVGKIGYVGQDPCMFPYNLALSRPLDPLATLTVGNRDEMLHSEVMGSRFGDPHAVWNNTQAVQVAGFFSLSSELGPDHIEVFRQLGAQEPYLRSAF